jgi:hypothetical protein
LLVYRAHTVKVNGSTRGEKPSKYKEDGQKIKYGKV